MALSEQTSYRLLGGGGVRGASGGLDRVLPADPSLDFFNAAMRRHRAPADLVTDPALLWSADPRASAAPGLLHQLAGASEERLTGLTDLLLVLSAADGLRAVRAYGAGFEGEIAAMLSARFSQWTRQVGVARRRPERPLGLRLLIDGSEAMGGDLLGLGPGEFVTGLLPNLYAGPAAGARPLLAVHLNLPGAWPGYREVARLFDDQDLLTLGAHWLDSFAHPALRRPALYRLRFDEQDGLMHLLSPDLGPGWRLRRHGEGPTVYAMHAPDGEVVAWMVLEVLSPLSAAPEAPAPVASAPAGAGLRARATFDPEAPSEPAEAPIDPAAVDLVQEAAPDSALEAPTAQHRPAPASDLELEAATERARFVPAGAPELTAPAATAAPMPGPAVALRLREVGVLLQRVHFPDVMSGYELYLDAEGQLGTAVERAVATLRVVGQRVAVSADAPKIWLDQRQLSLGEGVELSGDHVLALPGCAVALRDLRGQNTAGWPYLYELRREGPTLPLVAGGRALVGRQVGCRVQLPDDPHNDNILWRSDAEDGASVRTRGGLVPKARFATDSIMVAQRHVEIDVGEGIVIARCVADHCFAFLREGAAVRALSRRSRPTGVSEGLLGPGLELLVGNTVLLVLPPEDVPELPEVLGSGATLAPTFSMGDERWPPVDGSEAAPSAPPPQAVAAPPQAADELPDGPPAPWRLDGADPFAPPVDPLAEAQALQPVHEDEPSALALPALPVSGRPDPTGERAWGAPLDDEDDVPLVIPPPSVAPLPPLPPPPPVGPGRPTADEAWSAFPSALGVPDPADMPEPATLRAQGFSPARPPEPVPLALEDARTVRRGP
jgi:hypothetical protein